MAYFPDLSPCAYAGVTTGALSVGWLDDEHDFPKGKVPAIVITNLKKLTAKPAVRHRGYHYCELCGPFEVLRCSQRERRSSAVIIVRAHDRIYASSAMILHYVKAHAYLPPLEFLRAVEEMPNQHSPDPTPPFITPAAEYESRQDNRA